MKRDDDEARDNRRQDRADELRMLLQGQEYLRQLEAITSELVKMGNKLRRLQNKNVVDSITVSAVKARVQILKLRADINFRRLAKVLPDLRSIELTDVEGNNPLKALVTAIVQNQDRNLKDND
jgi:hypothetical protein